MRIRAQDANGDWTFGRSSQNYLVNTPAGVGQLAGTRLLLFTNEWFLNLADGTAWFGQIIGVNTQVTKDRVIKARLLTTQGVNEIKNYSSTVTDRGLVVTCLLVTIYGETPFTVTI